jgi:hypothetical protein
VSLLVNLGLARSLLIAKELVRNAERSVGLGESDVGAGGIVGRPVFVPASTGVAEHRQSLRDVALSLQHRAASGCRYRLQS